MKRSQRFFINALILGGTTIFMRSISVMFTAYVSGKIGAEGVGLYSLISSVYTFAVTLATSGISLAVTRLVSEELGREDHKGAISALRHCIIYALLFGCGSALILFLGADFISIHILRDVRTYRSLRMLAIALPFIALSNVFSGYFSAVRRISKSALASITEQFIKIAITIAMITAIAPRGIEYACLALVIGTAVSEALSFFYLFVLFIIDKQRHIRTDSIKNKKQFSSSMRSRMLAISLPIAFSSYLRSGLVTIEHILIPVGLRRHGSDYSAALSSYGTIHGMVFPLILFPSAICSTFAGLIIPELSELASTYETIYRNRHICYIVRRALLFSLLFGIGTAGILLCFADPLGRLVYQSEQASNYIRVFAPLVPVMYLDTTVDGMLKGLGQQMSSMFYNIIDASMSVLLVWVLMPKIGIYGYVICVFATELVNLAFSLGRLITVTGVRVPIKRGICSSLACIVGATSCTSIVHKLTAPISADGAIEITLGILITLAIYVGLLIATKGVSQEDVCWIRNIIKGHS